MSLHAGAIQSGHSHCLVEGCSCTEFTWKEFLPSFMAAYKKAQN